MRIWIGIGAEGLEEHVEDILEDERDDLGREVSVLLVVRGRYG